MKNDVTKALAILTASAIGLSLSGCSSQVDSVDQFFDNKSYEEGISAFREVKKWEPEDLSALAERMRENINKEIDLYAEDRADYNDVDNLLRSISELHISKLDEDLLNAQILFASLKTSKEHYTNAEKEFAKNNYTNAINLYQYVIEEDSHYDEAQKRIIECTEAYVDNCINAAENNVHNGLYNDAINDLLDGLSDINRIGVFADDHKSLIQEKLDTVIFDSVRKLADEKEYYNAFNTLSIYAPFVSDAKKVDEFEEVLQKEYESFLYSEAKEEYLAEAEKSAGNDMYASALDVLNEFVVIYQAENDSDIMEKQKEYEEKYVDRMLAVGNEFYQDGKILRAYRFIQDCNSFVYSEKFDTVLNEIASIKPIYLSELKCQNAERFEEVTTGDIIVDTLGNEYHPEDLNLFEIDSYNDGWGSGDTGYAEYFLGYQYNRLVGSISVDDKSEQDVCYTLTIEGDGVVLFSLNLDRKTVPTPVDLNVKGVQYLKFNLSEPNGSGHIYGILSDFHFEK